MKRLAAGAAIGAVFAVVKVWLEFHVSVPLLLELVNAGVLVIALIAWAIVRRTEVGAFVLLLGMGLLSFPAVSWLAEQRIEGAKAYCASPQGEPPTLFQPGYSVRYEPQVDPDSCSFPDPFPGRTFWAGERGDDGSWTFEHLMD